MKRIWLRLLLLVALLGGLYSAAVATGFTDHLTVDGLQLLAAHSGLLGALIFIGAFAAGLFAQIPGFVFISAAALAWGPVHGGLLSLVAGIIAVSLTFVIVRAVGGAPLGELKSPRMRRILSHLEQRPVRTVALLRVFFQVSPPVNYALALGPTRYRHYLLGSAVGLVLPIAVTTTVAWCTLG